MSYILPQFASDQQRTGFKQNLLDTTIPLTHYLLTGFLEMQGKVW